MRRATPKPWSRAPDCSPDASDGLMPWRGRPEILKRGLIARVPPIDFIEEETE